MAWFNDKQNSNNEEMANPVMVKAAKSTIQVDTAQAVLQIGSVKNISNEDFLKLLTVQSAQEILQIESLNGITNHDLLKLIAELKVEIH